MSAMLSNNARQGEDLQRCGVTKREKRKNGENAQKVTSNELHHSGTSHFRHTTLYRSHFIHTLHPHLFSFFQNVQKNTSNHLSHAHMFYLLITDIPNNLYTIAQTLKNSTNDI